MVTVMVSISPDAALAAASSMRSTAGPARANSSSPYARSATVREITSPLVLRMAWRVPAPASS
jgi:hypothetical protein